MFSTQKDLLKAIPYFLVLYFYDTPNTILNISRENLAAITSTLSSNFENQLDDATIKDIWKNSIQLCMEKCCERVNETWLAELCKDIDNLE